MKRALILMVLVAVVVGIAGCKEKESEEAVDPATQTDVAPGNESK